MIASITATGCVTTHSFNTSNPPTHKKDFELINQIWIATKINHIDIETNSLTGKRLSIEFDAKNNRFFASDGCNRIQGNYALKGNYLQLGSMTSTEMACFDQEIQLIADQYKQALNHVASYQIRGPELLLLDSSGNILVRFIRANQSRM
ncbi:META domain-containing protein [Acinetobacter beijerinckii]